MTRPVSSHTPVRPASGSRIVRQPIDSPGCSVVDLGDSTRIVFMLTPASRGPAGAQVQELLAQLEAVLSRQGQPMFVTVQTVFLQNGADQALCQEMFAGFYGRNQPVTNYVLQPPGFGAAVALEAWAIGGPDVKLEACGSHAVALSYDSVRWVYCAGIEVPEHAAGAHAQTTLALEKMAAELQQAGSGMEHVVRTWFYQGGITEPEAGLQRYMELNRARSDFYRGIQFGRHLGNRGNGCGLYPASTGIGMAGRSLVAGCITLQTQRSDATITSLENPQQTPAYAYPSKHSPDSPKFSRAVALGLGDYLTTWISGTASIVDSESRHMGDITRQTEQTLENIEKLISPENFAVSGARGAGASLRDIAKVRVYVKRGEDVAACRRACERILGDVPAVYVIADVCRPELLVEIEGVAFSKRG